MKRALAACLLAAGFAAACTPQPDETVNSPARAEYPDTEDARPRFPEYRVETAPARVAIENPAWVNNIQIVGVSRNTSDVFVEGIPGVNRRVMLGLTEAQTLAFNVSGQEYYVSLSPGYCGLRGECEIDRLSIAEERPDPDAVPYGHQPEGLQCGRDVVVGSGFTCTDDNPVADRVTVTPITPTAP
ncbi:MAG: hypothetical protein GC136_02795 [Alphaproteobacteria bacterium]|nr:hypothetical protein [Alphaproteobacteria bacterium]